MEPRPWHRHYDTGVPTSLDIPDVRLDELLARTATQRPDQTALVFFDRVTTFSELDASANRLAAALQARGVTPGNRVSVFMANCPQVVLAYEAIWRCGAVVVPSNPLYTAAEFAHQARDAGSKIVICMSMMWDRVQSALPATDIERVIVTNIKEALPGLKRVLFGLLKEKKGGHHADLSGRSNAEWLEGVMASAPERPEPVPVRAKDPAVLMYTGGTTGLPKGAILTHRNMVANSMQGAAWSTGLVEGAEVMLTAIPLSHSYGMTVCMNHSIDRGYSQVIVPDARDIGGLLGVISKHRPTLFPGVPALYSAILTHPKVAAGMVDLSSIKQCLSGAAGLPPEIQRRFQDATKGRLVEGYGLSEASPITHCNPLGGEDRVGSIGIPLPETDCRILDEETEITEVAPGERGVMCISGPQIMSGYWKRDEDTASSLRTDGAGRVWLHTGDVAVMDGEGFFRIVDRKKDMILASGGFNVYPREIEDILVEHPSVLEAGVIGVPTGAADQRAKAFVVLEPGTAATEDEIIEFCRERLARYKVPKQVEFRDELPRTFVGKVLRRELAREEDESTAE